MKQQESTITINGVECDSTMIDTLRIALGNFQIELQNKITGGDMSTYSSTNDAFGLANDDSYLKALNKIDDLFASKNTPPYINN